MAPDSPILGAREGLLVYNENDYNSMHVTLHAQETKLAFTTMAT